MVCSVESTRWPVSAASSAISIVSRSRISPTRITLGAWRSAARKRQGKRRRVAVQLALVHRGFFVIVQEFDGILDGQDVNGAFRSFMRSTMAASVDDLPEPVGPVTSAMPLRRFTISSSCGGSFRVFEGGNDIGNHAHDDREGSALPKNIHAKSRHGRHRVGQIRRAFRASSCCAGCWFEPSRSCAICAVWRGQQSFQAAKRQLHQFSAELDLRRVAGRKDQIAHVLTSFSMAAISCGVEKAGGECGVRPMAGTADVAACGTAMPDGDFNSASVSLSLISATLHSRVERMVAASADIMIS